MPGSRTAELLSLASKVRISPERRRQSRGMSVGQFDGVLDLELL